MSRRNLHALAMISALLALACGDADPPVEPASDGGPEARDADPPAVDASALSCEFPGSGAWAGTVDGDELALPRSAWVAIEADGDWWVVGLEEDGGRCFNVGDPGGEPPASGYRGLQLIFDGVPASGTFTVVPWDTMDAPEGSVFASVDRTGPGGATAVATGTAGTVTVTMGDGCFEGTFDITFEGVEGAGGGAATGAFAAYVCSGPG